MDGRAGRPAATSTVLLRAASQPRGAPGGDAPQADAGSSKPADDNVVDAEFKEVKK